MSAIFSDVSGVVRLEGSLTGATPAADAPQWAVRTLTSAEILALETTSVTIVAAPGAGSLIVPLRRVLHYRPGTTPYAGDPSQLALGFGASLAAVLAAVWSDTLASGGTGIPSGDFLATATDAYAMGTIDPSVFTFLTAAVVNKPLALATADGIGFSNGNGTLTVSVLFATITAAAT